MKNCDNREQKEGGRTTHLSATVFKGGLVPAKAIATAKGKPMLSSYRRQTRH